MQGLWPSLGEDADILLCLVSLILSWFACLLKTFFFSFWKWGNLIYFINTVWSLHYKRLSFTLIHVSLNFEVTLQRKASVLRSYVAISVWIIIQFFTVLKLFIKLFDLQIEQLRNQTCWHLFKIFPFKVPKAKTNWVQLEIKVYQ